MTTEIDGTTHRPSGSGAARHPIAPARRRLLLAALIVVATAVAYIPSMQGGFIWDDDQYVINNPHLQTAEGLFLMWLPRETPQYYPLVFTSFWIEYQLWELAPTGYHVVNVLLHVITSLLVWKLCARLGIPGAWMIAAVFALHPVHVESVAWITERKNVLSAMFYMLAFLAYLRFDDGREDVAKHFNSTKKPWAWYAAAVALFVCALLSKTVTVSLPVGIALASIYIGRPRTIKQYLPLVPMLVIGLAFALNTAHLERTHVLATGDDFDFTIFERIVIASRALLFYPYKLLLPAQLTFIYPRWHIDAGSVIQYWPIPIILAGAVFAIILARRGRKGPALALLFYAASISPALGFFSFYPMLYSFVADHFQYIASLGIIALVVGAATQWLDGRAFARPIAAVVLITLATLTWFQGYWYHDFERGRLWEWTLLRNPECWMAQGHLAVNAIHEREFEKAEDLLESARRLKPDSPQVHVNLAALYNARGEHERALEELLTASKLTDWFAIEVARTLIQLGREAEAEEWVVKGLEQAPYEIHARRWLAQRLIARGEPGKAKKQLTEAIKIKPNDFAARRLLGDLAKSQKQFAIAQTNYRAALEGASTPQEELIALKLLADALIRLASASPERAAEAVSLAKSASMLARGTDAEALAILGRAYAASRQREQAVIAFQESIRISREAGQESRAQMVEQMLADYEASLQPPTPPRRPGR